jgi:hypothetical protein
MIASPGLSAMDGGGGLGYSGITIFILLNALILGIGTTLFILSKIARSLRRNKKK